MRRFISTSNRNRMYLALAVAAVLILLAFLVWGIAFRGDGAKDGLVSGKPGGPAEAEIQLVEAWIVQNEVRKDIDPDNPLARFYSVGTGTLFVRFDPDPQEVKIVGTPAEKAQEAVFSAQVELEGPNLPQGGLKLNEVQVEFDFQTRTLGLWAVQPPTGQAVTSPIETREEVMVRFTVDPVFLEAFTEFCGFNASEVKEVQIRLNDRPRFQVALVGGRFRQAQAQIPAGQPIYVLVSDGGKECFLNPPCGNVEVPPGKLPPAPPLPPREEVMRPTPTPPVGLTPTPPAPTPTPTPGVTPTPTPTPTPVPPKCLVTILGPHRLDNTETHARMQASIQWDIRPNFSPTIRWFLDGTFVGGGEQVIFMAALNVNHTLTVKVFKGSQLICSDSANFAEGSIPPGEDPPGTDPIPTETPIDPGPPGTDPDDCEQCP